MPVPMRLRVLVSMAIGLFAGSLAEVRALSERIPRDFTLVWYAARAVLNGQDPYALIGPHKPFEYVAGLFYPLPGILAAIPFTPFPMAMANGIFMAIGAAVFAYALMEQGMGMLWGVASASFYYSVEVVQWTPLFAGAYALPVLGVAFAVKPQTGLAIFLAKPSWWAIGGAFVLTALAFLLQPHWIANWRIGLADAHLAHHATGFAYIPPVLLPGGAIVLLALARWRRPEARLLIALTCLPQSLLLYETVTLFLIPRTAKESLLLCVCSWGVLLWLRTHMPYPSLPDMQDATARLQTLAMYLPCTLMVLRRPNEGVVPSWLERLIGRWPARLRSRGPTRV